jgi:RNA polymerase sigma-70 factor (ECF subfamily)
VAIVVADRPKPLAEEDDTALVARCLGGERAAERELFRRERTRVHATLYRVLGSNRDMEDLVQEAFLEVFRSLAGWRGEAKLSTWVDRIAVRVAYRWISRRRPTPVSLEALPETDTPSGDAGGDGRVAAREGVRRLYAALAEMTPKSRLAFALHVIDGRPIAEVATLTGTAVVATKVRIWRARRELEKRAAGDPVLAEFLVTAREETP